MATDCDLYLDWHTGSDGNLLTDAIAAGSCRPTSPADAVEVYPGSTLNAMRIETDSASPVAGYVNCGGSLYNFDDTVQGAIYDHSANYTDTVTANVSSHPNVMSMGFLMKTGLSGDYLWHALSGMYGIGDAEWAILAPEYFSGALHLYVHSSQGYSASSVVISLNTWYWITIQYNATAGHGYLAVYDPTTWAQVGSTISLAFAASPPGVAYWMVGQSSQGGNTEASYTWFGPNVFDWTDGTFPLLPGASPPVRTAVIGTSEYSLPAETTSGVPTSQTTDGCYQAFIDFGGLAAGDQFRVRLYEKYDSGGTQRLVEEWILTNAQSKPMFTMPHYLLGEGWDITVVKLAGSDRAISWDLVRTS